MATFTVTSLSDVTDAADGVLTLREAAALANATAGADTIDFDTGVGGAIEGGGLIRLVQGEIEIADDLTLEGQGAIAITGDINGDDVTFENSEITDLNSTSFGFLEDNTRLFLVSNVSSNLTVDGMTLTGGRTDNQNETGGAIHAGDYLTVKDSIISGNSTGFGIIYTDGFVIRGGGGLFGNNVTIEDSIISNNDASGLIGTKESGLGFPCSAFCANLTYAQRNFHHSIPIGPKSA